MYHCHAIQSTKKKEIMALKIPNSMIDVNDAIATTNRNDDNIVNTALPDSEIIELLKE